MAEAGKQVMPFGIASWSPSGDGPTRPCTTNSQRSSCCPSSATTASTTTEAREASAAAACSTSYSVSAASSSSSSSAPSAEESSGCVGGCTSTRSSGTSSYVFPSKMLKCSAAPRETSSRHLLGDATEDDVLQTTTATPSSASTAVPRSETPAAHPRSEVGEVAASTTTDADAAEAAATRATGSAGANCSFGCSSGGGGGGGSGGRSGLGGVGGSGLCGAGCEGAWRCVGAGSVEAPEDVFPAALRAAARRGSPRRQGPCGRRRDGRSACAGSGWRPRGEAARRGCEASQACIGDLPKSAQGTHRSATGVLGVAG
mmetsp:Transcript_51840/g.146879  ORF Transcript_51840/g.146879 Transcript_51840/m.146879 type:complete len:315 (-) Transcript_51840:928-1872(-)